MARQETEPRFEIGSTVFVSPLNKNSEINGRFWNGLMWMYSFKGEQLSCGEMYLKRSDPAYNTQVQVGRMLSEIPDQGFAEFLRELLFSRQTDWARAATLLAKHCPELKPDKAA